MSQKDRKFEVPWDGTIGNTQTDPGDFSNEIRRPIWCNSYVGGICMNFNGLFMMSSK